MIFFWRTFCSSFWWLLIFIFFFHEKKYGKKILSLCFDIKNLKKYKDKNWERMFFFSWYSLTNMTSFSIRDSTDLYERHRRTSINIQMRIRFFIYIFNFFQKPYIEKTFLNYYFCLICTTGTNVRGHKRIFAIC